MLLDWTSHLNSVDSTSKCCEPALEIYVLQLTYRSGDLRFCVASQPMIKDMGLHLDLGGPHGMIMMMYNEGKQVGITDNKFNFLETCYDHFIS